MAQIDKKSKVLAGTPDICRKTCRKRCRTNQNGLVNVVVEEFQRDFDTEISSARAHCVCRFQELFVGLFFRFRCVLSGKECEFFGAELGGFRNSLKKLLLRGKAFFFDQIVGIQTATKLLWMRAKADTQMRGGKQLSARFNCVFVRAVTKLY